MMPTSVDAYIRTYFLVDNKPAADSALPTSSLKIFSLTRKYLHFATSLLIYENIISRLIN